MKEKIIHFGEFVRWHRVNAGKTTEALGREVGLTARRLIAIEAMAKPDIQHTTMASLARAFGIDTEDFDTVWKSTPVPVTRRKSGPTTDEARKFSIACAAAGTTQVEGLRRLRSWLVEQNPALQKEALSYIPAHRQHAADAFADAEAVLSDAGRPQSPADDAASHADDARSIANAAMAHASGASSRGDDASSRAGDALSRAGDPPSRGGDALSNAGDVLTVADDRSIDKPIQSDAGGKAGGTFTHAVDHLQDPTEAVAKRVGKKAARSAKQSESAATGENKHH